MMPLKLYTPRMTCGCLWMLLKHTLKTSLRQLNSRMTSSINPPGRLRCPEPGASLPRAAELAHAAELPPAAELPACSITGDPHGAEVAMEGLVHHAEL